MSAELIIMPGAPLLVPELSGADETATAVRTHLLDALSQALAASNTAPVVVLADGPDVSSPVAGSLKPWGADITIGAGHRLAEILARWALRECGADPVAATARLGLPQPDTAEYRFHADAHQVYLVVAEGPAALTPRAPLTDIPVAHDVNKACTQIAALDRVAEAQAALAGFDGSDSAAIEQIGFYTADIWHQLAELAIATDPRAEATFHTSAHGVGYHVARWAW
ncbi:hypothetical protein KRX51_05025 [Corynebacterium sp. TAE3-ERU12]|uniref:hypothetical protein n=1 Tax=Corynebacterium sp. TAE3-ERU12 TaxID=2849491 RepID=UPI001C48C1D4|nr:hypothetical protein [Corynebacterium sp. TAE3-ERU12]MBV7295282.1 hypothetical protein [Corynebacterium sp. TAE3-ERU12]